MKKIYIIVLLLLSIMLMGELFNYYIGYWYKFLEGSSISLSFGVCLAGGLIFNVLNIPLALATLIMEKFIVG
jgi:hypothetical protein